MVDALLVHAYSAQNSGDAWLVRWSCDLAREALGEDVRFTGIAIDPDSFREHSDSALRAVDWRPLTHAIRPMRQQPDVVIGVGGGYLRGKTAVETAKMMVAHGPQMHLASRFAGKAVYLPQSIGPFRPEVAAVGRRLFRRMGAVYVRDDRSLRDLAGVGSVSRAPDLAVLELARAANPLRAVIDTGLQTVWIVRELPGCSAAFYKQLMSGRQATLAIQSEGRGNDDRTFCESGFGVSDIPKLADVLRAEEPRIVVSVRLHGALLSLLGGWPAIHLSYERKGFGAFEDLGLGDFVVNVFEATPEGITEMVDRIAEDPARYWARIDAALPRLRGARSELLGAISRASQL